ncbi:MAG TPA: DUF1499 domain-containing protein [Nevskiaceae bacterium]|nr:DUF1499 domain-containing protein [Nevskiaceae bacterium]
MKRALRWFSFLALAVLALALWATFTTPGHLYRSSGVFAGCPARPSCVSSMASDDIHQVPALRYAGDAHAAFVLLREVVERIGGRIEHEQPGYLHAVFVTPRMRYRDDLELLVQPDGRIEVRSLSRFGYRDFGVNRRRVEELRRQFEAQP